MTNSNSAVVSKRFLTTYQMALVAVMAAVICIFGPLSFSIPISPVPISLASFAIYLTVCILGWKLGTFSVLIYLLLGIAGMPVFSAFGSGFAKVAGPTGGYLIGYLFLALISGYFIERFESKGIQFIGMLLGTAVLYGFGTVWLCAQAQLTFVQGLFAGVIPFIPADVIKMIMALFLGNVLRKRLQMSGLLSQK